MSWRLVAAQVIRLAGGWGRSSNERAIDQARDAAAQASRVAVERAEVELFLQREHGDDQPPYAEAR